MKRWKVGDEVVVHCNQDDGDDEECNGGDPMFSASQRIWGYETPDGSFAQFCRVQDRQLMERPKHLTWEEAACYTLTLATAYRMLFGHGRIRWAGRQRAGLGRVGRSGRRSACSSARPPAPTPSASSRTKTSATTCMSAGRQGRPQPQGLQLLGPAAQGELAGVQRLHDRGRKFGKAIWDITGKKDVDIVFEHPGEQTFPVSSFVVKRGGMVVFCAGTTGFNITFDARFVWMRQKRIQGSHFAHLKQAARPTSSSSTGASTPA